MSSKHNDLNDHPSDVWPPPIVGQPAADVTTRHKAFVWLAGFLCILCTILGEAIVLFIRRQVFEIYQYTLFSRMGFPTIFQRELITTPYCYILFLGYTILGMGLISGILRHKSAFEKFAFGLVITVSILELVWRIVVETAHQVYYTL